jgi:hypothetical protein
VSRDRKRNEERLAKLARNMRAIVRAEDRHLRLGRRFPRSLPPYGVQWFAGAVDSYLAGKAPSLDKALGLQPGRGRSGKKGAALAIKVAELRQSGMTVEKIAESLGVSDRYIRAVSRRHGPAVARWRLGGTE